MNKEAKRWLGQANQDLKTAQILYDAERYGPCAFYCQQAAEKMLKSALYDVGERPWGHSVPALLDQVCAVLGVAEAEAPTDEAVALDEHYMRPRYPDAQPQFEAGYNAESAQEALDQAQAVFAFVRRYLSDA